MEDNYNINQTTLRILGLFSNDYHKAIHVREIARNIQIDVKAVGIHLNRLEKTNVLSSTLRGRNKEYHLNLSNPVTVHYIILAEAFASIIYLENTFLIKKLTSEIAYKIDGTIILFGSFARGEANEESDIDLFVISEKEADTEAVNEAGRLMGREINMKSTGKKQFLNGLMENDPLIKEVVSNHIVIKGVDNLVEIMWRYHGER